MAIAAYFHPTNMTLAQLAAAAQVSHHRTYAADRRACPRPGDRPAPAAAHPAVLRPCPGMARRDERNVPQ